MMRYVLLLSFVLSIQSIAPTRADAQWWLILANDSLDIQALGANVNYVYAGFDWTTDLTPSVYRSTDYGQTWQPSSRGLPLRVGVSRFAFIDTFVYAGIGPLSSGSLLYRTSDNGDNWMPTTLPNNGGANILDIATGPNGAGDTNIYIASYGVFVSANKDTIWQPAGLSKRYVSSLAIVGTNVFAFTQIYVGGVENHLDSILVSSDYGSTWKPVMNGLTDSPGGNYIAAADSNLIVGTGNHVYLSTNQGTNWQEVNDPVIDQLARYIFFDGSNIFLANQSGIFLSTDYGKSWIDTQFPTGNIVWSMASINNLLFASVSGQGVYRRDIGILLSVKDGQGIHPKTYVLEQNYPNPLNPSTTIQFTVPHESHVTMKVYNLLGQEVRTLVNENRTAGTYNVEFDGSNLSSGVYFYTLQAGRFMQTKKMLVLK